jgi:D-3-phosphoglycerate dehydrogenase
MARFKVVVSDQVFPSVDLERSLLAAIDADLVVAEGDVDSVLEVAGDADAILNTYLPWDAAAIARLEQARIIARYGIGVDNVDLEAAARAGIVVTNVPDYSVEEVAAHALALMLNLARRVGAGEALIRSGGWSIDGLRPIRRLSTLTVGLYGFGRIARRLAAALQELGMSLIVHDPYVEPGPGIPPLVEFEELLARSDILSVHAPLTPETRGIIDARALAAMPESALLVNTSRGPLVVLDDLTAALRAGSIAGAALDVFDAEPLDPARIEDVPNLVVTPHMAYYSEEALEESQRKAATQVVKVLTGEEPDYQVNRGVVAR